ncbi:kinase-like domain-containing protein [Rhizophagus clarus]|uniref:Kinase-like domain-containing protein n=1 Tax=Rhizophagus clarus TaxID=94130 RepID=A0A8H3M2W4_9GLOM|nr:kinase-like domain-containing protein [Rhizophagus clarus]
MTTSTDNKNDKWALWIKNGITNEYDYREFQNIKYIGNGRFSNVYRANWKSSNITVALKSLKNGDVFMKEIVNEITLMQRVEFHENIIQFFGITSNTNSDYLFIFEYADSGTLRNYLNENFNKLGWNIKLRFATQLVDAILFIHKKDITHNDLHSGNIMVHQNNIKLEVFVLSHRIEVSNSAKDLFGKVPYINPQCFKNQTNNDNKKSDVYSVGVLLWEISSGQEPFKSYNDTHSESALAIRIANGEREIPVFGTPVDYINIYDVGKIIQMIDQICIKENTNMSENNTMKKVNNENNSLFIKYSGQINSENNSLDDLSKIETNYVLQSQENYENDLKIIMTGIEELNDLDINNTDHYKRINISPSLECNNYEVFGSVISKNKLKLENILIIFKSYDFNGFSATIKTFKNIEIDITECYILWMIIGNPLKFSVFSSRNQELQVYCIKRNKYSINLIGHGLIENTKVIDIPSTKFFPLISEIESIFKEIIKLEEAAEHNIRTCKILKQRVYVVNLAVLGLKDQTNEADFFNNKNFLYLQDLTNIIKLIKNFIVDISQMKSLIRYIKEKNIDEIFIILCKELHSCVDVLSFPIDVEIVDELEQLKSDHDDLVRYLQEMEVGIKKIDKIDTEESDLKARLINLNEEFFSTIIKVTVMNKTMKKLTKNMNETFQDQKNQTKIDDIFQVRQLKFSDYEHDDNEKQRKNGRVTKWYNKKNKDEKFAFKIIIEKEDQKIVQNQVTILKEFHNWQNIINFYGLTCEGNKWYLVTEWAEYGNLREFYTNHKDIFDLRLKLQMSLDIARGLNFLRTVEIVHGEIGAVNILITSNKIAKLANFKLSRYLPLTAPAPSLNQNRSLERVRYKKIPYEGNDNILDILDKKLKPFIITQTIGPKITKILEVLTNCFKDYLKIHSFSQDSSNSSSSNLSRERAYSIQIAYKCFEAYANLRTNTTNRNQIKARYYKAYYISRGFVESPPNKDKIVSELFKEVADDEVNEFPEAKVRYGDCLYKGKGVEQNFSEALKYFEKAAEDNIKVAMYNVGNMNYYGTGCAKNNEKAIYYMKLAAYNDYDPAIKFCKDYNF